MVVQTTERSENQDVRRTLFERISFSRRDLLKICGVGVGGCAGLRALESGFFALAQQAIHPSLKYTVCITKNPFYVSGDSYVLKTLSDEQKHFNEQIEKNQGYMRVGCSFPSFPRSNCAYARIDIDGPDVSMHNADHTKETVTQRLVGYFNYSAHVSNHGKEYEWKEQTHFLKNEEIFEYIVQHAKQHSHWREQGESVHRGNTIYPKLSKFPKQYDVTVGAVTYKIEYFAVLFDGNRDEFEEAWKHRVLYAPDAVTKVEY